MIPTALSTSWPCGRYIVRQTLRFDNPAWPAYLVFRGQKLVGRSFSVPDAGWCAAIERITRLGRYVEQLSDPKSYDYRLPRRGRPSKAEVRRRMIEALTAPGE